MIFNHVCLRPVIWLLLLANTTAFAGEPKSGDGGAAIKKAQGLIRQLSQEKTALEAEKTALLADKNQLEDKLKALESTVKKLEPLQGEVERYKSGLESVKTSLESQLGQERQRQQALLQKHNDVVGKANSIFADNQLLVQAVKEREAWINQCSSRNQELRQLNQDLLARYKDKGLWQHVLELDSVTGIGKIEAESVAEEYRYKLQQLKITPFKAAEDKSAADAPAEQPVETPAAAEANP
ncbi:hypothetical protein KEF85_09305 [Methylomonas paludis]|uniref:Chromosome segregation ATPase n=1 Tax=Methylomonas paludis TaxID=1173101 RepID=A0A975MKQ0_9GAMM|nr:hypothetical protein [Methylomonas paludis]QWF69577.1 hypothetical protein KEF85_09305 [Methylomonas paludis]